MNPIGIIHSPFKEKFSIPRGASLGTKAQATIELLPEFNREEAIRGLESFSYIWLIFEFHQAKKTNKLAVRAPRLGGNQKMGVFATRSPFRPNPIGISAVKLIGIENIKGKYLIKVEGVDLLDQTPILDIKPYLEEVDCFPNANNGWCDHYSFPVCHVSFKETAQKFLEDHAKGNHLKDLITQILSQDPRPSYYRSKNLTYKKNKFSNKLEDIDVHWSLISSKEIVVDHITPL